VHLVGYLKEILFRVSNKICHNWVIFLKTVKLNVPLLKVVKGNYRHIYIYIYMPICVCVCIYIYIHIYIYKHTHTHTYI
jgi:hypothetical protein